jgi:FkbM family methyltransferase
MAAAPRAGGAAREGPFAMIEKLKRLPNFLARFGVVHGLRLGLGVGGSGGDTRAPLRRVSVPGYDAPIILRRNRSDYSIFWQCLVQNQYDIGKFDQMAELLRRSVVMQARGEVPVIIDGGGNIGLALRSFAEDFPFAHIVCVEPDSDNMAVLARNAECLGDRATLVQGAIASRSGHSRVIAHERGSAGLMTEYCEADADGAVPALTIPELAAKVPGGRPWIVKLDIEGAQDELFSQNTDWVAEAELIILEPDDWAFPWSGSTVNFFRALSQHRFDYLLDGELVLCFRHRGE